MIAGLVYDKRVNRWVTVAQWVARNRVETERAA